MDVLFFDCFSGISGDMVLGAMLDLGVDLNFLRQELAKLKLDGFFIEAEKTNKKGIHGTQCHVILEKTQEHHRHFGDIKKIIQEASLCEKIKETIFAIFSRVAKAEAKVHNVSLEQVHFHEVGALDSIIDIAGAAICYHALAPSIIYGSKINVGSGWVRCAHGLLPVPAPATIEILCQSNFEIYSTKIDGELTTPTGAAILAELGTYSPTLPSFIPEKTGYGFGEKDFGVLNALRIIKGRLAKENTVMVIESNMDDMTGEMAGYALEKLMQKGALDVFYTPIYMKKNRPGIHISILCETADLPLIEETLLKETTTIGLRKYSVQRLCMKRHYKKIMTDLGEVTLKICDYGNIHRETPEYEDIKRLAIKSGESLATVLKLVEKHHSVTAF